MGLTPLASHPAQLWQHLHLPYPRKAPAGAGDAVSTNISCHTGPGHYLSGLGLNTDTVEEHGTASLWRLDLHSGKAFYSFSERW